MTNRTSAVVQLSCGWSAWRWELTATELASQQGAQTYCSKQQSLKRQISSCINITITVRIAAKRLWLSRSQNRTSWVRPFFLGRHSLLPAQGLNKAWRIDIPGQNVSFKRAVERALISRLGQTFWASQPKRGTPFRLRDHVGSEQTPRGLFTFNTAAKCAYSF